MKLVSDLLVLELGKKRANRQKLEAMAKKVKDRLGHGDEDGQDEISELQSRLKALQLPEET